MEQERSNLSIGRDTTIITVYKWIRTKYVSLRSLSVLGVPAASILQERLP